MSRYEDILELPHPAPRQKICPWQRGAQFSPFAALTGFEDVVAEEARLTQPPMELGEDARQALNDVLAGLKEREREHPQAMITWFCPDSRKEGGSYITTLGTVKRLDELNRELQLCDGQRIPLDKICDVRIVPRI